MQENNFEKKVQQKMDGLTLSPSGEVWQKIHFELAKKQQKKRGWLIFVLLFMSLAGGGLILIQQHSKTTVRKNDAADNSVVLKNATTIAKAMPEKISKNNRFSTTSEKEGFSHQNKIDKKPIVSNTTNKAIIATIPSNKGFTENEITTTGNTEAIHKRNKTSRRAAPKTIMQVTNAELEKALTEDLPLSLPKEFASFSLLEIENRKNNTCSTIINNEFCKTIPLSIEKAGMRNVIKKEKPGIKNSEKHRNLLFLISFGIGKTATASNYLGATANRIYYDNASSVGNNNGSPGSGNSSLNIPSSIKPATGLFLGFSAAKPLTKKSSLSIGLQYQFIATFINVGQPLVASNGSRSFATGNNNNYSNQYHFVQIPIELSSQLSHFKKHNFFLNAGVSLSQLLQTNALQFDNTAGRYFISNDNFNKTIIGVSVGLSINLLNDNRAPLLFGPSFSYSLTPIAGKGLYDKSNYGFLGIRLQKVLKKK